MRKAVCACVLAWGVSCVSAVYAADPERTAAPVPVASAVSTPIPSAAQVTYADTCGGAVAFADQLFDAGRFNDALSAYRKAEPRCGGAEDRELLDRVRFGMGRSFLKQKDIPKAVAILKTLSRDAVDAEVKDISTLILAQDAFAAAKDDEALIMLTNITDTSRRDEVAAYALFLKAEHLATVGSYAKASEMLRLLDEEYASSGLKAAIYFYRALCAIENGEPKVGLDFLDALDTVADEDDIVHRAAMLRVRAYAVMKTMPDDAAERALFAPFVSDAAFTSELSDAYATMLAGLGKNAKAAKFFSDSSKKTENTAVAFLKAARAAADANDLAAAKSYLSNVFAAQTKGAAADEATQLLVYMLYDEGSLDKAKQTARERLVLSSTPESAAVLLEALSRIYTETYEPEKVFDAYDAVMNRFPSKAAMFYYLKAEEYAGQSRLNEAYTAYEHALALGHAPAEVRYAMARCKERTGDEPGAAALYAQIADAPDAPASLRSKASYHRAEIASDAADLVTAKAYWAKTVALGLEEAAAAKKRLAERS